MERARDIRNQNLEENSQLDAERLKIAAEREQILKAREQLVEKERSEIERRDFMKMIVRTAENAREIAKDGQRQIIQDRETRLSRE